VTTETTKTFTFSPSPWLAERSETTYKIFTMAMKIEGDVAECGVYLGHTAHTFCEFLETVEIKKTVHLFDSFQGFPDDLIDEEVAVSDPSSDWANLSAGALSVSESAVRRFMSDVSQYEIHAGFFCDTFPQFDEPLCFIHADGDLYTSTADIIKLADRVLVPGGLILFDDYGHENFPGVKVAVMQYLRQDRYEFYPIHNECLGLAVKGGGDPALRPPIKVVKGPSW